mmetsp:Transcript_14277/g.30580  ORF Transcript_14277/g.30580 Transcript_14277/m.30580 type:complete len:273 (+) Transcript_14277:363-1181(+)
MRTPATSASALLCREVLAAAISSDISATRFARGARSFFREPTWSPVLVIADCICFSSARCSSSFSSAWVFDFCRRSAISCLRRAAVSSLSRVLVCPRRSSSDNLSTSLRISPSSFSFVDRMACSDASSCCSSFSCCSLSLFTSSIIPRYFLPFSDCLDSISLRMALMASSFSFLAASASWSACSLICASCFFAASSAAFAALIAALSPSRNRSWEVMIACLASSSSWLVTLRSRAEFSASRREAWSASSSCRFCAFICFIMRSLSLSRSLDS